MAGGRRLEALAKRLPREDETVHVEANLGVDVAGTRLAVDSNEGRIQVHVPSVLACVRLLQAGGGRFAALAPLLAQAGITAEIRTGDAVLAVVGEGAEPDIAAAALSVEAVEIRPGGVVAGLLRFR